MKTQVRIEIECDSLIRRWVLDDAVIPLIKGQDLMSVYLRGEAVTLQSRITRSRSSQSFFTTSREDIDGKFVFINAFDTRQVDEALSFAAKSGARALLASHEPDTFVTIPTILIPPEICSFIENLPSPPQVTVVPFSGSYRAINVELRAEQVIRNDAEPVDWTSKMFIPTAMLKNTTNTFHVAYVIDATPFIYRDVHNKIDSIGPGRNGDRLSGKICLFNVTHPGDADRLVKHATELGASGLILCGRETPDFTTTKITLPVLANIDSDQLMLLKKAGLKSGDTPDDSYLELHISYGNEAGSYYEKPLAEPERKVGPPGLTKLEEERKGFFSRAKEAVGNALGFYSPFSKTEFTAVIREGTSWSFQGQESHSYQSAEKILHKIAWSVDSLDKKKKEIESLVEAVVEMTKTDSFVGDVMVLLFCQHLFALIIKLGIKTPTELLNAMCTIVSRLVRDLEGSVIKFGKDDRKHLNECIRGLTTSLAHKAINKSKLVTFVTNSIWIRYHVCGTSLDSWDDLRTITSLKGIESNRESFLSFMELRHYNTFLLASIALPADLASMLLILRASSGCYDAIPILPCAMRRFQVIYECNRLPQEEWKDDFGEIKEISVLNLIGQLAVDQDSKKDMIVSVIKSASFESVRSYQNLHVIFSSLSTRHKNHDMIKQCIQDFIFKSLTAKFKPFPDLKDISILLHDPIGLSLVSESGWKALMSFLSRKEVTSAETDKLINLFADVYECFACSGQWFERKHHIDVLEKTILCGMQVSSVHFDLAVSAFQVASQRHNAFASHGDYTLCTRIAKIIIDQTGLVSTVRSSPDKLLNIPSFQLSSNYGESLIECLHYELIKNLNIQCSKIDNAVSFCSKTRFIESQLVSDISSNVLLSSFSSWRPSKMEDLLSLDASTLAQMHKFLVNLPDLKAQQNVQALNSIATKWIKQYERDGYDAVYLTKILSLWSNKKQTTLREAFNESFPTKTELEKKLSEIDEVIQSIRSKLTFCCVKDETSNEFSIRDMAAAYHLNTADGTLLPPLMVYVDKTDPDISLARIYSDKAIADSLVQKYERELQAAVYFLTHKSVLFHHELGSWVDMKFEEFMKKLEYLLEKFEMLLSPKVKYSYILEAALVIAKENVKVENELNVINSTPNIAISCEASIVHLQHSIAVARISKPLENFIKCCTAYKFSFVTTDNAFIKLTASCEKLENDANFTVEECCALGKNIADLLTPETKSMDLPDRLDSLLPVFHFFDALRFCSSTVTLAKERAWFGDEGLKVFYKEYGNVSNMFTSNQESFENEILDRLEPTMRVISSVGEALSCSSVADFIESFKCHNDILKVEEMRLIQSNICKIQDWFEEGMDDMAAMHGKLAMIMKTGIFVIKSKSSDVDAFAEVTLSLQYSRSTQLDDNIETMSEENVKDFVQHIGFNDSTVDSEVFIGMYRQLSQIRDIQHSLIAVGYSSIHEKTIEYAIASPNSPAEIDKMLNASHEEREQCNQWLKEVRSEYKYSLLFHMDELLCIYKYLSKAREAPKRASTYLAKILEAVSRLSPEVTERPECLELMIGYVLGSSSNDGLSWFEDAARLVDKCGNYARTLNLECFQAIEPGRHKRIVIHKINCCADMTLSSPLRLLQHIYKTRIPASFEVLDGASVKSSNEISLFLERVIAFPDQTFTILQTDQLKAPTQDVIATFLTHHARSVHPMNLHCVQLKDTIIFAPPGVEVRSWDDTTLVHDDAHLPWLRKHTTGEKNKNTISIVSGSCGSGKTTLIREEMAKLNADKASIYIHEDFSMSAAVNSLQTKFAMGKSQHRAIHFGFSLPADECPQKDLLLSINAFFNSFLLFGIVFDAESGNCFHSGLHQYRIFVEVGCAKDRGSCQDWFGRYIPVLSGSCDVVIQPPLSYTIDEPTRRVCTYLRAYDNGTIDRKFNPTPTNKKVFFVLDYSESMEIDLGGRNALEVATDCMLSIFDSHVQEMDHVGLIRFNHDFQELIPLQQVTNINQRRSLREAMHSARNRPRGSTHMFRALSHVVSSLSSAICNYEESWIICLTDGQSWDSNVDLKQQLQASPTNMHIGLIGVNLDSNINRDMEDLCRKYQPESQRNKGFFLPTSANMKAIEQAFGQVAARIPVSQTFELDGIMSDQECLEKLDAHRPEFIHPSNKLLFSFWVHYLHRRCSVFDQNDDFNYNENQENMGSSLMEIMLSESRQNLRREQSSSWTSSSHTQLIYDFSQQGKPQFRLICTAPDDLAPDQKERLSQLELPGFFIPTPEQLRKRQILDLYLSQALGIPLHEDPDGKQRLKCIDDNRFVLTLDFCLKLLNIHERVSCGVPCIMEGETGVSKTALTKMYSILINSQQSSVACASTQRDFEAILHELSIKFPAVSLGDSQCTAADQIRKFLKPMPRHNIEEASIAIYDLVNQAHSNRNALFAPMPSNLDDVSELLSWFGESCLEPTFFDINIHGSLTADELKLKMDEARRVARKLDAIDVKVIVFLDEINTSCTLGLLKEIIVDHSFNGDMLEDNIVVIAACNPVRKSFSQTKLREIDLGRSWASGHYQVRKLPKSLSLMTWDYGSLNTEQEKEFIYHRIFMMDCKVSDLMARSMTEVISCSHELIRTLAKEHLRENFGQQVTDEDAIQRAKSAVSLRDIQRVFHLINFFLRDYTLGSNGEFRKAMLIAVGMVYYLRLDSWARAKFVRQLEALPSEQAQDDRMLEVLDNAMNLLIENTEVPEGVALTRGLRENVFMTTACTLSRTPLMIIGPPGCSKTLAVSVVTDNANGEESPSCFYRKYARIQPFHYQCSKTSTSNEVASVFDRAIQRQSHVGRSKQQCMVFMDEAGLPEEEKESLKVLHYHLEGHMSASPTVAFVCITNHVLDAAKSNRCVCLLRPEPDKSELLCIAVGVLCQNHHDNASNVELVSIFKAEEIMTPQDFAGLLCECYLDLIRNKAEFSWFVEFFGLRDFIHLIMCIRRTALLKDSVLHVSPEIMVHALERNFNGVDKDKFSNICASFLARFTKVKATIEDTLNCYCRHPMRVLQNALSESQREPSSRYNLPRYKMIIDETDDDSVMRLLRASNIVNPSHSFHMLSGLEEGAEFEQLNLVSKVKFAAQQGDKTVVMSQVEAVSECFYDLFNQHFKEFRKADKISYFANIAVGGVSRPSKVHPSFQCIVHVQSSQLDGTPAPFLNRFEKFRLNIEDILTWQISRLPVGIGGVLSNALNVCKGFLSRFDPEGIWSVSPSDSVKSIFISMVPQDVDTFGMCRLHNASGHITGSFSSTVLSFIKHWFVLDTITEFNIQQGIDVALSELEGIDKMELEKVRLEGIVPYQFEQELDDFATNGKVGSPSLRSLKAVVHIVILRYAVMKLMQVAMPEAVFLQRECLPKGALRAYLSGNQNHFHLKSVMSGFNSSSASQLFMIFVHSDACSHSLPTWCQRNDISGNNSDVYTSIVTNTVHDEPSAIEIFHLDLLKSEAALRVTLDNWVGNNVVSHYILVVDMQLQSSRNLVNFVRSLVEQMRLPTTKRFVLLLHYPLSVDKPSYPALFLGNWQCSYLDGVGYRDGSSSYLPVNNVFEAACFDGTQLNANRLLDALLPKAIQYVSSRCCFYSSSIDPRSVNQKMQYIERHSRLEAILECEISGKSLAMQLIEKYLRLWTTESLDQLLHRAAVGLKSGTTNLSLSTAVRSTFQHTFNKFFANALSDMNVWSNLDICHDPSFDFELESIFSWVLSALPVVPLNELELQRDVYQHLNPAPLDTTDISVEVFFPFYFHISSFIDAALDKAIGVSSNSVLIGDQAQDIKGLLVHFDDILEAESRGTSPKSMAETVQRVINSVESSDVLYERYLKHHFRWKLGAKRLDCALIWASNQVKQMALLACTSQTNIVLLHILCRQRGVDIIRMSSWNLLSNADGHLVEQLVSRATGNQFVAGMLSHFKTFLVDYPTKATEFGCSFSAFLRSIPNLLGQDDFITDEAVVIALRQLVLVSTTIAVNAPEADVVQMIQHVVNGSESSLLDFFRLIDANDHGTSWSVDAKHKLLRTLFSQQWIESVLDIGNSDALTLIDLINMQQIDHQRAVVYLRNLLLYSTSAVDKRGACFNPMQRFCQPITLLLCRKLTCQNTGVFSTETERREQMPHYIPAWLRGNMPVVEDANDDITWFFREYKNCFENCPLADVIFDIMLSLVSDNFENAEYTSDQLLLIFQEKISRERDISRNEQIKNARQALQSTQKEKVSFTGTCISAIETSVLLVSLVCKMAIELASSSQAYAFSGIGSNTASCILEILMKSHRWSEFFFAILIRLRGKGHIAVLLQNGGKLAPFAWAISWKQGVVSVCRNVTNELTTARDSLQQSQRDVAQFMQQYRACPRCRGAFGVDQRNCGQFICGRDAHGIRGRPAIGGQAVQETHGCGSNFTLDQALPYVQSRQYINEDQPAIQRLEEELEQKETAFNEFNESTELWRKAEEFKIPFSSFHVHRQADTTVFRSASLTDSASEGQAGHETMNGLVRIIDQLPGLKHISYLPDMIEVVTKEMAMHITMGYIVDERLLRNRFGSIEGSRIEQTWLRAAEGIECFLNENESVVQWNCEQIVVPFRNLMDMPLMSILSEMECPSEGHDYLFLIINEIVLRYNNVVKSISSFASNENENDANEISPRSIVQMSQSATEIIGTVSSTETAINELIESYWLRDKLSFDRDALLKAIRFDMGVTSLTRPIKSPMSFLREQFYFRESSIEINATENTNDACICTSDGLFFARNADASTYDEVLELADEIGLDRECHQTDQSIVHTMIFTFHAFSYSEWMNILEGLRNVLCYIRGPACNNDINCLAQFASDPRFGFPALSENQSSFINSIRKTDLLDIIFVCGQQLSAEAYSYSRLPSRLAEPMPMHERHLIRDEIRRQSSDAISHIESFSKDVLEFYCDRLLVPASESENRGLVDFLQENNCCDDTDAIFSIIPKSVSIRNYIDVQKTLYQAKLELLFMNSQFIERAESRQPTNPSKCFHGSNKKSSAWKWSSWPKSEKQDYQWRAFGDLWFEEALRRGIADKAEQVEGCLESNSDLSRASNVSNQEISACSETEYSHDASQAIDQVATPRTKRETPPSHDCTSEDHKQKHILATSNKKSWIISNTASKCAVFLHAIFLQWSIAFAIVLIFFLDWFAREFHFYNMEINVSSEQHTLCAVLGIWLFIVASYSLALGAFSTTGWILTAVSVLMAKHYAKIKSGNDDDISLASVSVYTNAFWDISILDMLILVSLSGFFAALLQLNLRYRCDEVTTEDVTAICKESIETTTSEPDSRSARDKISSSASSIVTQLTNDDNKLDCVGHLNGFTDESSFGQEQETRDTQSDFMCTLPDGTTSNCIIKCNQRGASIVETDHNVNLNEFQNPTFNTHKENRYNGIQNIGNTCYLSASLQALLSSRHFLLHLRRIQSATPKRTLPLTEILLNIAAAIKAVPCSNDSTPDESCASHNINAVHPQSLKDHMDLLTDKFKGFEQRDAHEFLCELIDHLYKEANIEKQSSVLSEDFDAVCNNGHSMLANEELIDNKYSVGDCFRLKLRVHLECNNCKCSRTSDELYQHLSLNMDHGTKTDSLTVQSGLDHFFRPEVRAFNCEKCTMGHSVTQTSEILSCPKVLLIHFKRYIFTQEATSYDQLENTKDENYTGYTMAPSIEKNRTRINLDEHISIPTIACNSKYHLRGVVHHIGNSASSGHYTSCGLRSSTDAQDLQEQWVHFNDSVTAEHDFEYVALDENNQRNCYIAVYELL